MTAPTGCGNVWSSAAIDKRRRLVFFASSNCDTDDDPTTLRPPPPMPPYDEAIVALHFNGTPAWRWRPREIDNNNLAFGAVPNLFKIKLGSRTRDVVGVGNKDGTYYVIDREGVNVLTGVHWDDLDPSALPYWSAKVVLGGDIGGIKHLCKRYMVFHPRVSEYIFKGLFKMAVRLISAQREPVVFDKAPQDFNEVKFRAIGGQVIEEKPGFFPLRGSCFKCVAGVLRGIIEHHPRGLGQRFAQGIETKR